MYLVINNVTFKCFKDIKLDQQNVNTEQHDWSRTGHAHFSLIEVQGKKRKNY